MHTAKQPLDLITSLKTFYSHNLSVIFFLPSGLSLTSSTLQLWTQTTHPYTIAKLKTQDVIPLPIWIQEFYTLCFFHSFIDPSNKFSRKYPTPPYPVYFAELDVIIFPFYTKLLSRIPAAALSPRDYTQLPLPL